MGQLVTLHDKQFKPFISHHEIAEAVKKIAGQIDHDFEKEVPYFLVVLNGAFVFAADLLKAMNRQCELAFVRASSYKGTERSGEVDIVLPLKEEVKNRSVVIVEDIVETGNTLECLHNELKHAGARSVKVASLLFKKEIYKKSFPINYFGISIPNDFVVGYGLDYNGMGRDLKSIYVLV